MRTSEAEIAAQAKEALIRAGAAAHQADPVARALARSEAEGVPACGLFYLPIMCSHLRTGKVAGKAVPRVAEPRPGAVTVDAADGFAHPSFDAAIPRLVAAARSHGVAAATITNSTNALALGHPADALARHGLIGLALANAPASVAPPGSTAKLFGTNPIAFAAPVPGAEPLVVDQSTSAVTKTALRMAAEAGQTIPEGWAQDVAGRPTRDAKAGLAGSMLPAGGQKGANIALLVELLAAALAGAALSIAASPFGTDEGGPSRTGQFLLALDPAAFAGEAFAARIAALAEAHRAAGLRLPGARRHEARARAAREGIALPEGAAAALARLSGG